MKTNWEEEILEPSIFEIYCWAMAVESLATFLLLWWLWK